MRLIDTDKLKFPNIAIFDMKLHGVTVPMVRLLDLKELMPTVEAVPLDKLCEWLARNAYAFECKDCEEYCRALLECGNEAGSNPEYWKNKLTTWMEGLDAEVH